MGRLTLSGADKSQRLAYRAACIPKDARLVPGPSGCAVYRYDVNRQGVAVFGAMAFRGTAAKPEWHYIFKNEGQRENTIREFFASVETRKANKTARATEKAAWTNPLTIGQILYTSWGYDQTNVEFYVVTRVSGRRVWMREIAQDTESTGFMQEKCWPAMPIRMVGEEFMRMALPGYEGSVSVKINSSAYARPENGRAHHSSSYA